MGQARFVDFHCHLDLYPDLEEAIAACDRAQVFTLAVTTTPRAWERNHLLASKSRYVRAALGLHPQLVRERAREITLWKEYLPTARYVGEVGLDAGPRFIGSLDEQKRVFDLVLRECARAGGKILSVHSVRSSKIVLDMIEKHLAGSSCRVVLHWFTGSGSEARRAADLGCYFSINHEMLKKQRSKAIVAQLPVDRLLTETDGPFTMTAQRPSRPDDVCRALAALADLRGEHHDALARTLICNLRRLLAQVDAA